MRAHSVPEELIRIVVMRYILRPAAVFLPRKIGMYLAKLCALPLFLVPSVGPLAYFQLRDVFSLGRVDAFKLAWKRLSSDFISFLVNRRVLCERENVCRWRIEQRHREYLDEVLAEGESFIVATGHFNRHVFLASKYPEVVPGKNVQISVPYPPLNDSWREFFADVRKRSLGEVLHDSRVYLQYRTYHDAARSVPVGHVEYCFIDKGVSAIKTLNARMKEPGYALYFHIDAPWMKKGPGSIERPFAAMKSRLFATGAGKLAQKFDRPIIPMSFWYDADKHTYVYEYGKPIRGGQPEEVTSQLVDFIERAIGERPADYPLAIGSERKWNPSEKRWEDL